MSLSVTVLTLLAASGLLPFAEDVIQVKAAGAVTVSATRREVRIENAGKLAKKWARRGLCPRARADGSDLVLECTTARLHAERDATTVSIYALRGLPWAAADEPAPRLWFDPSQIGLGGACPGNTTAGKAECLLAEGRIEEAKTQLSAALETVHKDYAALRMADLAIMASRPIEAMEWLEKAGRSGEWGRLASIRQCELSGRCFAGVQRDAMFDPAGMPAPLRDEVRLRQLRLLRYESPAAAVAKLFELGSGSWPDALCSGQPVCVNVLVLAMSSNDADARIAALTLFAAGPVAQPSALRPQLAEAAADAAIALGAPQYAAAALAAATPDVPRGQLASHLRKVIKLYEASGQPARAAAVTAYAIDTVGLKPAPKRPPKSSPLFAAASGAGGETPIRDAELASELASAALVRSKARAAQ